MNPIHVDIAGSCTLHPGSECYLSGLNPETVPGIALSDGTIMAGRFRIEGLLGSGLFTRVYRALDLLTSQPAALKVPTEAPGAELLKRELRLYRRVKTHEHVLRVYDLHKEGDVEFLSVEPAEGGTMRAYLDLHRNCLALRRTRAGELLRALCLGLTALEEVGIVMVDLKPENLLFLLGVLKISDLGLCFCPAEQNHDPFPAIGDPSRWGTPGYMSPEQERGADITSFTFAAPIYSVGCILYEMLSSGGGLPPQRGAGADLGSFDLTDLRGSGEELERIVARCLARDPRSRYGSARELLKDWESADGHVDIGPKASSQQTSTISSGSVKPPSNTVAGNESADAAPPVSTASDKDIGALRHAVAEDMEYMNLPNLDALRRRGQALAPSHPLLKAVQARFDELEGIYTDLTWGAWESTQHGDWVYAKRQLENALQIRPGSLDVKRALEVLDCMIEKLERLMRHEGPGDNQVMVCIERMADYVGILLGLAEETPWTS